MEVLNKHNWIEISKQLLAGHTVVVDNFFSNNFKNLLFNRMIYSKNFEDIYPEYKANNYTKSDTVTSMIVDEINKCNLFKNQFQRAWSFVYNNKAKGTEVHSDPSCFNINVWVTPDEYMDEVNMNGLIIYKLKPLIGWTRDQWNGNENNCIDELIENKKPEYLTVPYKCNRAIIFDGMYFHKTNDVSMLDGFDKKRVSYTMLFGKNFY